MARKGEAWRHRPMVAPNSLRMRVTEADGRNVGVPQIDRRRVDDMALERVERHSLREVWDE